LGIYDLLHYPYYLRNYQKTKTEMKELLENLNACLKAREWAEEKTWKEVYGTCHRGDWLLWLFKK